MSSLKYQDTKREEGFTLIELLVVVIIIGILAAIAIPVFLSQRERARESAVDSALRSAATYQEVRYTESGNYTNSVGDLRTEGYRDGDVVLTIPTAGASGYCMQAAHAQSPTVFKNLSNIGSAPGNPQDGSCGS